jgi:AcrR family transcriptional regulator
MSGEDGAWASNASPESGTRRVICETMLEVVGELGYIRATVDDVIARAACSRTGFYRHFANKEECCEVAYRYEAERLVAAMLAPSESGADWTRGLIGALRTALGFAAQHPARAHGLLILGQVTGGNVAAVQQRLFERLTRALDGARRLPGARHSAPPLTATMMIGAVENLVRGLLVSDEAARAPDLLGDLTYLIVQSYFGDEEAFAAMDAARAF